MDNVNDDGDLRGALRPEGTLIAGKYRVVSPLGTGSTGAVYLCEHTGLAKQVAVKILHPELIDNPGLVQRFEREAQTAAHLDHPNSVHVMDFGQDSDGTLYLVMEYVEGRDLADLLTEEWPLSEQRLVDIMSQVLSALAAAHALGIVHRDLKPENILVRRTPEGDQVKVCDFGIAQLSPVRLARADAPARSMPLRVTGDGMVVGTPSYMSPEQARARTLDARSDVYSAGVVLFQLLTRTLPFIADTPMGVAVMHCTTPPPPPSGFRPVNRALEMVCLRALSKTPEARYQSAIEMRTALQAALTRPRVRQSSGRRVNAARAELARRAITPHALAVLPTERIAEVPLTPSQTSRAGRTTALMLTALALGGVIWAAAPSVWSARSALRHSSDASENSISAATSLAHEPGSDLPPSAAERSASPAAPRPLMAALNEAASPRLAVPRGQDEPRAVSVLALAVRAPRAPRERVRTRKTDVALAPVDAAYASDAPSVELSASVSNPSPAETTAESNVSATPILQVSAATIALPAAAPEVTRAPPASVSKEPVAAPKPERSVAASPLTAAEAVSSAKVTISAARSSAGVSKASIRGALNQTAVKHCYIDALRRGDAPTTLLSAQLDLITDVSGHVVSAHVQASELSKPLRECVEQVARTGRVRDVDTGEASVSVTLNFAPH
jgi:serine/threonine protein kinase